MGTIRIRQLIDPGLLAAFPDNVFVRKLVQKALDLGIYIIRGTVPQQWLYHPAERVLCVWEPDLKQESLSFLVVILAHEIGHVIDFDQHPELVKRIKDTHWSEVPVQYEVRAFVNGYLVIKELGIPVSKSDYLAMIDEPMAGEVSEALSA